MSSWPSLGQREFMALITGVVFSSMLVSSEASGVGEKCEFAESLSGIQAEIIVSIDAFEHFGAPEEVLRQMAICCIKMGR